MKGIIKYPSAKFLWDRFTTSMFVTDKWWEKWLINNNNKKFVSHIAMEVQSTYQNNDAFCFNLLPILSA